MIFVQFKYSYSKQKLATNAVFSRHTLYSQEGYWGSRNMVAELLAIQLLITIAFFQMAVAFFAPLLHFLQLLLHDLKRLLHLLLCYFISFNYWLNAFKRLSHFLLRYFIFFNYCCNAFKRLSLSFKYLLFSF